MDINEAVRIGQYVIVELKDEKSTQHSGRVLNVTENMIKIKSDAGRFPTFTKEEINCVMDDTASILWD